MSPRPHISTLLLYDGAAESSGAQYEDVPLASCVMFRVVAVPGVEIPKSATFHSHRLGALDRITKNVNIW